MKHTLQAGSNIGKYINDNTINSGDEIELGAGQYTFSTIVSNRGIFDKYITILGVGKDTIIQDPVTIYLSGIRFIHFKDLCIKGRINIDDVYRPSTNIIFEDIHFLSDKMSGTECVKLTRVKDSLIINCYFERTLIGYANDRLLDVVGGSNIQIINNNFYNGNNGAIQIKGGHTNGIVRNNFINMCGQRAIQIGGSTCWIPEKNIGCWGTDVNGEPIKPSLYGYEAIDCVVENNIVINNGSGISISTQKNTLVKNNIFWTPSTTGGMFLFRTLQEVEQQTFEMLKPSTSLRMYNNVFLYPVNKLDGGAGINGAVVNWNQGQDFGSFKFEFNACYATSPILSESFGKQKLYPHRHPVTNGPGTYMPYNWKSNLLDQVYPSVIEWGTPRMRCLGYADKDVGVAFEYSVGAKNMPIGLIQPPPLPIEEYGNRELYGWEGNGSSRIVVPLDPKKVLVEKILNMIQELKEMM